MCMRKIVKATSIFLSEFEENIDAPLLYSELWKRLSRNGKRLYKTCKHNSRSQN